MLFFCVKDGGSTKFETTPGGDFIAGIGVTILPVSKEFFRSTFYMQGLDDG